MKPSYVTLTGTVPKILLVDSNLGVLSTAIRAAAGITVEFTLEDPQDSVAPNSYTPPVSLVAPVWVAAPAAVNGVYVLNFPVSAIRLTPTAGGQVTVLQQGIQ